MPDPSAIETAASLRQILEALHHRWAGEAAGYQMVRRDAMLSCAEELRIALDVEPVGEVGPPFDRAAGVARDKETKRVLTGARASTEAMGWSVVEKALAKAHAAGRAESAEELVVARETNGRLNRRCQHAESVANWTVERCKRSRGGIGRALANYGYTIAVRERDAARAELSEAMGKVRKLVVDEKRDAPKRNNTAPKIYWVAYRHALDAVLAILAVTAAGVLDIEKERNGTDDGGT